MKKGIWKDVVDKTTKHIDGGTRQMLAGLNEILSKQPAEADTGVATCRAQNGNVVCSSKGGRELLEEHYHELWRPQRTKRSTQNSSMEFRAWAAVNVD